MEDTSSVPKQKSYLEVVDGEDGKCVLLSQSIGQVVIDPSQWEELKDAIDFFVMQCRK
jgi:hypothetical protein